MRHPLDRKASVNIFQFMADPLRLAIVDDHELFRDSLTFMLATRGFETVAQAASARTIFPLIDRERPDVVLMDVALPGMDGITATHELVARHPAPKVLMLSMYDAPSLVAAALQAGANGYALKSRSVDELVGGIRRVAGGERWIAPGLSPQADAGDGPLASLSTRERDIFRLLIGGLTMRDIAQQLCISPKTVDTHRQRIFKKLDVHSAVQLLRFAAAHDLLLVKSASRTKDE